MPAANWGDRPQEIQSILQILAPKKGELYVRWAVGGYHGGHLIEAWDRRYWNDRPANKLFATSCGLLWGQYYEIWGQDEGTASRYLDRSFLHLYVLTPQLERDEVFCLHAEPQESLTEHAGRVKASLHVHFEAKEERLQTLAKAHIPLCYLTVKQVLASPQAFDDALRKAMRIVKYEILDRYGLAEAAT